MAVPLGECPARCNLRGLCAKRQDAGTPYCTCHQGFKGLECAEVDTTLCLNNCSVSQGWCDTQNQARRPQQHMAMRGRVLFDCFMMPDLCLLPCWPHHHHHHPQGRGECKSGFCHCSPGYWGRDCGRSTVYPPNNASARATPGLRVYAYDLPMEVRGGEGSNS
jgi:hypothetical protein